MLLQKFIVYSLSFIVISLFLTPFSASAQTTPLPLKVSPTSPLYSELIINNMFHSFSCLAIGQSLIGQPCLTYQVTKNAQGMLQGVPVLSQVNTSGGALGATTSIIGVLYKNPPVRTADYLASVGQGLGIVKVANAQVVGSGADVLSPILKLWQVSRNISYVIMIIIFIIIGLMIMFRNKINPQTIITAQAALPGLVVGLILITFSYFLAGLVSDTAFIGTNVVGYYFSAVRGEPNPQDLVKNVSEQNIAGLFTPFTKIVTSSNVADALGTIWNDLADPNTCRWPIFCFLDMDPQKVVSTLAAFIIVQLILPFAGMLGGAAQLIGGGTGLALTGIAPVQMASQALAFIAMVILIYTMFKLLMRLITAYLTIIFLTFTAPFQLLAAALPGRQGMATNWILNMLANVLAFPAVLAVLYFVAFILGPENMRLKDPQNKVFILSQTNQIDNSGLVSPSYAADINAGINIAGQAAFPLFGGLDMKIIRILLAFGALVALPKVPDIVAGAIGKMGQAGQMLGQEIGGSVGEGRRYAGQFQSGTAGFAGQVGRLTTAENTQYLYDPNFGGKDKPGYRPTLVKTEGQYARAKRAISNFRNRFGGGTKI